MTKIYSERLRDVRTFYGYSQREIAKTLNIERSVYTEWEIYRSVIPLKHLIKLADFYAINVDYLLGLTDNKLKIDSTPFDSSSISSRLSNIRKDLNFTTQEFAKILHVSKSTISRYETGKVLVSTSVCYDIARNYNISVDYILCRTNKKHIS